jgi:hypothetical protein
MEVKGLKLTQPSNQTRNEREVKIYPINLAKP